MGADGLGEIDVRRMSQPASSEHPRPATPRPVDQQGTGDTTPVSLESSLPAPDIPTANPPAQNSLAIDPPDSSHSPTPPPATSHPPPAEPTPTPASPPAPTPRPPAYAPRSQAAVEQGVQLPSIEHSPLSPPPTYNRNAIRILPPRAVGGTETPALPPPRPPSYIAIIPPRSIMGVIDPEKDTFTPISGIYQLNAYGKFTGFIYLSPIHLLNCGKRHFFAGWAYI